MARRSLLVGLTGSIGSGKSEVSRRLAARGAVIVDADVLAKQAVAPGSEGLRAVVAAFGSGVMSPDGALDRAALADRVFADPAERERLNAIVHPAVRRLTVAAVTAALPGSVVVNDVPLLVEAGLAGGYDCVVVVTAPVATRLDRLVRLRGMRIEDARARSAAQATDEQRTAVADYVVVNDGSLSNLDSQINLVWSDLLRRVGDRNAGGGAGEKGH